MTLPRLSKAWLQARIRPGKHPEYFQCLCAGGDRNTANFELVKKIEPAN